MPDHCTILGVPLVVQTREAANLTVREWLAEARPSPHIIVTPNPEFCVRAAWQSDFRQWLRMADLRLPDGVGLVLFARLLWQTPLQRIPGTDFLFDISQLVAERQQRLFLLGAQPGVAKKAGECLIRIFPGLTIVGAESGDGPDSPGGERGVVERIHSARPDVVAVAFGAPRQEQWMADHRSLFPTVRVFVGVGGAFDFISGTVPRAPYWFRRLGLEWVFRLWQQPRRLARIFIATVVFPILALVDRVRQLIISFTSSKI